MKKMPAGIISLVTLCVLFIGALSLLPGPAIGRTRDGMTFTVTNTNPDGPGSLEAALFSVIRIPPILDPNDGDTIEFAPDVTGTITLTGDWIIGSNLKIIGPGKNVLTINGNGQRGLFDIAVEVRATISGLTLSKGTGTYRRTNGAGGAIVNHGKLIVNDCTFKDNVGGRAGGAIFNDANAEVTITNCTIMDNSADDGGGIYNDHGTVTIDNSTISDNFSGIRGGGIYNLSGKVTINNSTVSNNLTARSGGGIYVTNLRNEVDEETRVFINNCTISNNVANTDHVNIDSGDGTGGGVSQSAGVVKIANSTITGNLTRFGGGGLLGSIDTVYNTIVAGNFRRMGATPNDIRGPVFSANNNLVGNASLSDLDIESSGGMKDGVNGNIVGVGGVGTRDINTILNTTLADNGGPTKTHALVCGSPAIDAGNNTLAAPLTKDQRGLPRVRDGNGDATATVDMGAVEIQNPCPTITAQAISLSKESSRTQATIATVNDSVDDEQNLIVRANGGALANVNHVIVTRFNVDSNGTVKADLAAFCDSATADFTLSVTNSQGQTALAKLTVTVTPNAPSFTSCPGTITQSAATGSCSASVAFAPTASDLCDGTITPVCKIGDTTVTSGHVFSKGTTTVTCTATDLENQTATCSFNVIVTESQPPTVNCPRDITQGTDPNNCSALVSFNASATDLCDGAITPVCKVGDTIINSPHTFPKGMTTVTCTATDATGNQSSPCSFTVTVNDTQIPDIACNMVAAQSADAGNTCSATVPDVRSLVRAQATDACTARADLDITQSPEQNSSVSGVGSHPITVTVKDAAGNTATCVVAFTVNDKTTPAITCSDISATTDGKSCAAVVNFNPTVTDNCTSSIIATCIPPSGTAFGKGMTTVNCSATDAAGNIGRCSFKVTITDDDAPTVTNADINTGTSASSCSTVVNFKPTVNDNCDKGLSVICMPESGSTFPKGTTTVKCSTADTSGNKGEGSFKVIVVDDDQPSITCLPNINTTTATNQCSATVSPGAATATDNCGVQSITGTRSDNQPLNAPYPKGTTTITWKATDTSGNMSTCDQTITVADNQLPNITCPANVTAVAPQTCPPATGTTVTFNTPNSNNGTLTDNCPNVLAVCSPPSGSTFPTGTTTVTCTATDASSNTRQCSFTVTVFNACIQDNANPGRTILFNTFTGDYSACCATVKMTGRGRITQQGCIVTLDHTGRVRAQIDFAAKRGNGSVQPASGAACTISDTDIRNNSCQCSVP